MSDEALAPTVAGATRHLGVGESASTLTPVFKLVFLTVVSLTVLAMMINLMLVVSLNEPSAEAKALIETCSTIVKTGFGAIVGLIGGKAI